MFDLLAFANKMINIKPAQLLFKVLSRADVQAYIINLNTEDQLKGRNEDALGIKLSSNDPFRGYSITTQYLKQTSRDKVTLYDTGDYYESFAVIPLRNASFDLISNTKIHGNDLKERWGEHIEGVNTINLEKVNIFIESKIILEIEKLL